MLQLIAEGLSSKEIAATLGLPLGTVKARARYALPPRYLLAVGNPKPHKNLRLLRDVVEHLPAPLVLLAGRGARRWTWPRVVSSRCTASPGTSRRPDG